MLAIAVLEKELIVVFGSAEEMMSCNNQSVRVLIYSRRDRTVNRTVLLQVNIYLTIEHNARIGKRI
jgi:ABC-type transporter Mla maintaining outer membrane lipid asymmetry ATPase subunit MlaF